MSWNSNSLEGNTLSLEETIEVIEYDEVRFGHTYIEYQEAKSMYAALYQKVAFEGNAKIDLEWIKDTNRLIMQKDGELRKEDMYIGTTVEAAYYPPKYQVLPEMMEKYIKIFKRMRRCRRKTRLLMWQGSILNLNVFTHLRMGMEEPEESLCINSY